MNFQAMGGRTSDLQANVTSIWKLVKGFLLEMNALVSR